MIINLNLYLIFFGTRFCMVMISQYPENAVTNDSVQNIDFISPKPAFVSFINLIEQHCSFILLISCST